LQKKKTFLGRTFFHAAKAEVEKDLACRRDYKVRRVTILIIRICNVRAVSPRLMFVCRWYALLLARSVNTQLALCGA
jgi:hypothetical protein